VHLPPDYAWRRLDPSDIDQIVALNTRWEEHHRLPFRSDRAEVEQDLADPAAGDTTMAAYDGSGTLRGVGWVFWRAQRSVPKHRAIVHVIADPDHEDLENTLIDWCDATGSAILEAIDDDLDKVLRAWSPDHITDRIARFQNHGYEIARYFSTLSRPVVGAALPAPPAGVVLVDWDQMAHGRAIFDAHSEAFADHWGVVTPDWDTWQREHVGDSHSRLDLSVIALADNDVIGYSLNQLWPEDATVRGLTEGYLGAIGVRRAWRKRGVATSLILESIQRFAAAGLDNATLTADADSITGAFQLYQRLGFETVDTDVTLTKTIRGSR
jgi:ribosomal protein S18 acetylase RimI-like enzyme